MIDLYFWTTPNGYKITILLEELGWDYNLRKVHIGRGEQFDPDFLRISPHGKIPAIVDHAGPGGKPLAIFESGAIMLYLAEKAGWTFLASDLRQRAIATQWLMFQMASVGPMLGQAHHFRAYADGANDYAVERYTAEANKLYRTLDKRLAEVPFLAGEEYTIADMATYPWIRPYKMQGQDLGQFPNLQPWYSAIRARPAVQRGLSVLKEQFEQHRAAPSPLARQVLFGQTK
jgi:GSH-dependent disulfide-bond oxidoreductase